MLYSLQNLLSSTTLLEAGFLLGDEGGDGSIGNTQLCLSPIFLLLVLQLPMGAIWSKHLVVDYTDRISHWQSLSNLGTENSMVVLHKALMLIEVNQEDPSWFSG